MNTAPIGPSSATAASTPTEASSNVCSTNKTASIRRPTDPYPTIPYPRKTSAYAGPPVQSPDEERVQPRVPKRIVRSGESIIHPTVSLPPDRIRRTLHSRGGRDRACTPPEHSFSTQGQRC